jgi:predicted ATP-grasp superfamily ATP-dependent carboligase
MMNTRPSETSAIRQERRGGCYQALRAAGRPGTWSALHAVEGLELGGHPFPLHR